MAGSPVAVAGPGHGSPWPASVMVIVWPLLSGPVARYAGLGAGCCQTRTGTSRVLGDHVRQIRALGLEVTLTRTP
jgi:hypothetical protein